VDRAFVAVLIAATGADVSAHAADIDRVLWLVHLLMLVLFAGWGAYFVWALVRFRAGRQKTADPAGAQGRFASATEIGVVIAEAVLLVGLALPLWFARTSAQPRDPDALTVRVVAEQFTWNVHYPGADGRFGPTSPALLAPANPLGLDRRDPAGRDDILLQGQIHVPVNRPLVILLSSKDVIHSFGVHAMRVKHDAIPGVVTPIWFTPTATGTFDIACSQLCGIGHYRMRGQLIVESDDAFRKFLAAEAAALK
jgi:cytochrome c oxidase subunit 2